MPMRDVPPAQHHVAPCWPRASWSASNHAMSRAVMACSNHMARHRGQLTVYLRLNEEKVPAIYGHQPTKGNG
jgi:uncharacterized damage-inducible protein DinB